MYLPAGSGISCASGASTSTNPITAVIAPAVCRMSPATAIANRPSTARYRPPPATARSTPGSLIDTGTLLFRMAEPTKNEAKQTISPMTSTTAVKATILAASIGHRLGTASSDARIIPVEYSLESTSTPSTQMVSWPNPRPTPRIEATGSLVTCARVAASVLAQPATVSAVISTVNPIVTIT